MTLDEIRVLSDRDLDVEIAKALGWEVVVYPNLGPVGKHPQKRAEQAEPIPHFTKDLNAVHETGYRLLPFRYTDYLESLLECIMGSTQETVDSVLDASEFSPIKVVIHRRSTRPEMATGYIMMALALRATARQRSEALLLALQEVAS